MIVSVRFAAALVILFIATAALGNSRDTLRDISAELVPLLEERAMRLGEAFDRKEVLADIESATRELKDSEVEPAIEELTLFLTQTKQELITLRKQPIKPKVEKTDLQKLIETYKRQTNTYSNWFSGRRSLKVLFESNPFRDFQWRHKTSELDTSDQAASLAILQSWVTQIAAINESVRSITQSDIDNFVELEQKVAESDALQMEIFKLVNEQSRLHRKLIPLLEHGQPYLEDAGLNCYAEPIDFSCGSRCEITVRDPIFGHYKKDVDRDCLSRCNGHERQQQNELNDAVYECQQDKREAQQKLGEIRADARALKQADEDLSQRLDALEFEQEQHGVVGRRMLREFHMLQERVGPLVADSFKEL